METGKPIAVSQIAGTFSNFDRNPSARLIHVDRVTNLPVKINVFELQDLSLVKKESEIVSLLKYTYPDSFGMRDLSPTSYAEFAERILNDEEEALNYNS